jgi:hypothetical protein
MGRVVQSSRGGCQMREFLPKTIRAKNNSFALVNSEKWMLLLSLAVVCMVNVQVLFTFFYGDDFLHFYQIANWKPLEFIFSSIGGHPYIFRNFVFYGMFKLFGLHSWVYFLIVLCTHLGCAFILYKIIRLLTGKAALAAAGVMIWGICPAHYQSLTWYSAYGHMLVGFFFLLLLYDILRIDKGKLSFSTGVAIRWSIYLLLMGTSYGIGLAVACLAPAAIIILLWQKSDKWKIAFSMLPVIALLILLFMFKNDLYYYFSGIIPDSKAALLRVPFSTAWRNFECILELFAGQCAFNIYCAAAFPFFIIFSSFSAMSPPLEGAASIRWLNLFYIAIPAITSIPVIMFFLVCLRKFQHRRYHAVVSLFFLGLMGLIATEHGASGCNIPVVAVLIKTRFYYITLMLVMIMLALLADELFDIFPDISTKASLCIFAVIAMAIYPCIKLAPQMDFMNPSKQDKKLYLDTIASIEKTIQASPEGSSIFIDNTMNEKISLYPTLQHEFPGKAAMFAITYPHNTVKGRRVYFVEKDCHILDKNTVKKHWRTSSLMVSACE